MVVVSLLPVKPHVVFSDRQEQDHKPRKTNHKCRPTSRKKKEKIIDFIVRQIELAETQT